MTITPATARKQDRAEGPVPSRHDGAIAAATAAFVEETEELDAFLSTLSEEDFARPTPMGSWQVKDALHHMVALDRIALLALTDPAEFAEARDALLEATAHPVENEPAFNSNFERLRLFHRRSLGHVGCAELLAQWREGRLAFARATSDGDDRKIEWFGPPMRISRLISARQMEVWAYGQDVFDTFRVHRINGDRLYYVADFGVRTRGFAFAVNALPLPEAPFVELLAPSGRLWRWGSEDAATRISGTAEDFALVATQRRAFADTALTVEGEGARQWMGIAQTIAGAPNVPPAPGQRAWELRGESSPALPHAPTVAAMVDYLARRYGDRPQIVTSARSTSFREIEEQSAHIAAGLLASGVAKGARVGILMPNGVNWVAATLGVQRAGGVAVLISTFAKGAELAHIIRHSDAHMLLMTDRDFRHDLLARVEDALPELRDQKAPGPLMIGDAPYLRAIYVWDQQQRRDWTMTDADLLSAGERLPAGLLHATQAQATAADPAIIIYTSGTQAEPKAIVHTQGHLVRQSHRMSAYMSYQPGDSMITTMPLFWVGGLVTSLLAASYRGAAFACPDTPDPSDIAHMINDKAVTHVALWPPQLAALLAQDSGHMLLQRLRANSGQQLGLFGHATPETTPNSLGMTETLGPHSMEYFGPALRPECAGSFGRQVGRIERAIADPETGALLPAGSPGEILLRGGHMMMGMHRKEREEVFTPDGWYRTGDIGLLDDQGHLYFLGRQGDLVKSSGANISPREVEVALHGIDGVQEAVVLGMPDPAMGEKLVAVIVAAPGAQLTEGMIQAALRANMSSYKVPKSILFMEEPALPRTASGKVPKDRLRALLAERMATDG